jgi:hypothetical protein
VGQQQLLLIVLGVIIVGIAVVVGINVFTAQSEESAKDAIVSDCTTLGGMAQYYFRKPTSMSGGSNSFTGWAIPANLDTTANGTFAITTPGNDASVVITGTPLGGAGYTWTVVTTITPTDITSVIDNGGGGGGVDVAD